MSDSLSLNQRWWLRPLTPFAGLLIAVMAALLFVALTSTRLKSQGIYYDEVHSGPVVFDYFAKGPRRAIVSIGNVPLLVATYIGAIKPTLYAAYLHVSGASFSIISWRLLAISLVAGGLFAFCAMAGTRLRAGMLLLFLAFFLTDIYVLLNTRLDWGPVAVSLAARLLMLGLLVRIATQDKVSPLAYGALGCMVGLCIYDKLSNVVLIGPLVLALLVLPSTARVRSLLAGGAGLALGGLPLVMANAITWSRSGTFVSFRRVAGASQIHFAPAGNFFLRFISNGNSANTETWMLGHRSALLPIVKLVPVIECVLIASVLIVLAAVLLSGEPRGQYRRLAIVLSLSYVLTALSLYVLPGPKSTEPHHWIIATPFHYLALAIVFGGEWPQTSSRVKKILFGVGCWLSLALVVARLPAVYDVERSLVLGRSGRSYDRSLTRLGELAKLEADEALFVATNWGVAHQIFMLSNGRDNLVYEPFWNYSGPGDLSKILDSSHKNTAYAVSLDSPGGVQPDATRRIEDDFTHMGQWHEVPAGDDWNSLAAVVVRKFVRSR